MIIQNRPHDPISDGFTQNGVREGNGYARITTDFEWSF